MGKGYHSNPKGSESGKFLQVAAVLSRPQAQRVPLAVYGDAQREVDGPVGDLASAVDLMSQVRNRDKVMESRTQTGTLNPSQLDDGAVAGFG
jgi:hypothetical protein